jgi:hypothetical protein
MALSDLVLSSLAFPQNWDGVNLELNVLLLPATDPTSKLTAAGPAFAGTSYAMEAVLIRGTDNPPVDGSPAAVSFPIATPAPPDSAALFAKLKAKYGPAKLPVKTLAGVAIRKVLPDSYTNAFPYSQARSRYTVIGDAYGCAIRSQPPTVNVPPPTKDLSWGNIISFALRQPAVAKALGLVYSVTIQPAAADLASGGWLYVRFVPASNPYAADLAANPDLIKLFAARLPAIPAPRTLFAPVLYPVGGADSDAAVYDQANQESQAYDDGFAKIVHCNQPRSADTATEDHNELTPASDVGLQIGWDDEQVAIWMNRQLDSARGAKPVGLPLGVLGYRVDVREKGVAAWQSLCAAQARINFDPSIDGTVPVEPPVEPSPARARNDASGDVWLPRYFAHWRGNSLVVADDVPLQLSGGKPSPTMLDSLVPPGLLRYGTTYEFRVRLGDLTQGGPTSTEAPRNPASAAIGACKFQRWIKPRAPRTETVRDAAHPETITQITAWRPLLGYPEFLFAGVPDSAVAALIAEVAAAKADNAVLGANDPDVNTLRIAVEARTPAHDTTAPEQLDGPYRLIYQVDAPFPPLPANPVPQRPPDPAEGIVIQLVYQDVANIRNMAAPAAGNPLSLPVPRARDLRIRLIPFAQNANPDYFGSAGIQTGITVNLSTRSDEGSEQNLFDPAQPLFQQINAVFLQPGEDVAQRLAKALGLEVNGLTFSGKRGQRNVFGSSGALRHTLSGDHAEITFGSRSDLVDHWVVALMPTLDRDWTWDGFNDASLQFTRDGKPLGSLDLRQTVNPFATASAEDPTTQRDSTRLVFFDAVDPNPDPSSANPFPAALKPQWTITPRFKPGLAGADPPVTLELQLPKAARPAQIPRIVSAGLALSPYQPSPDYSATAPRRKVLWIEFEEPLRDPADTYFARVLAYAPDPLLVEGRGAGQQVDTIESPEPPLPIDPGPVRIITPNQGSDTAGLEAMTPLIPAAGLNPRQFMVPLPPGLTENSLELFGFFTYEIRVGHAGSGLDHWSTAQARYGRPLRVTGVQHPAPPLECMVTRRNEGVFAIAPFAAPVRNGQTLIFRQSPNSALWALLYTQVMQADGSSRRNILLAARKLFPPASNVLGGPGPVQYSRDVYGIAEFTQKDDPAQVNSNPPRGLGIDTMLAGLGLPANAPLSVLAVEMMPQYSDIANNPVDADFGKLRILRTSPLVPVPMIC